jgi:ABC-type lipopolysaccharide export system ATPase subunit
MTGYLRLQNLVKSYDGKSNAVDDISIDVARGEFVTFLERLGQDDHFADDRRLRDAVGRQHRT